VPTIAGNMALAQRLLYVGIVYSASRRAAVEI
jgi:hypothetical protein